MRKALLIALTAGAALSVSTSALAADGCGRGAHRGPHGRCHADGGVVVAPGLVVGNYYRGQGYWDGNRYWHNRYRDHGAWRYR